MIIVDGSFLLGIAAIVTSVTTLWRAVREWRAPPQNISKVFCCRAFTVSGGGCCRACGARSPRQKRLRMRLSKSNGDRVGRGDMTSSLCGGSTGFMKTILTAAALWLTLSTPAFAWDQSGHRIIGTIAQDRISGKTRAEIEQLIGNESLAEAATFADEERSNPAPFWQKEAGPWHYVTVPTAKTYAQVGAPPKGDGYTALERFTKTLRDPKASRDDKQVALRFIIHIVGDLHQPLHAGNGNDRGGNDVKVRFSNENTNLHSVWDTALIEGQNLSYTEYAMRLEPRITPQMTIEWWSSDPLVWIAESAALRDRIYPTETAKEGELPALSYEYQYQHLPAAEQRLEQGGVRLAAYLDWVFAETSHDQSSLQR